MKFMLVMITSPADAAAMTPEEFQAILDKHAKLRADLEASGELLNGAGLTYLKDCKSVTLEGGEVNVSPAPVPASGEEMTGYYVFECADEARAIEISGSILDHHVTRVEVRSIHDSSGM
jgi:hypothetical protein